MKSHAMIVTASLAIPALLAGCALPANIQIASWALDGISFLTTQKSLTDHGLSLVAQKDCALWRGFTDQDICSDYDTGDVMLADAGEPTAEGAAPAPPAAAGEGGVMELAAFETASGAAPAEETPAPAEAQITVLAPAFGEDAAGVTGGDLPRNPPEREIAGGAPPPRAAPAPPVEAIALAAPAARRSEPSPPAKGAAGPRNDYLYVIGSFSRRGNAKRQAGRYAALGPAVVAAVSGGDRVYRVVVGPFARGQGGDVRRRIAAAGIRDAWTVRAEPTDRFVARYAGLAGPPPPARPSRRSSVRVVTPIPEAIHRVSITIGPALATASGPGFLDTPGA